MAAAGAPAPLGHAVPPATTKAPEKSPFHVIGELPVAYLTLQSAGDRRFLMSEHGIELQLIGDEVVQDPLLKRGLPGIEEMYHVNAIAGRWPDAAWLSTSHPYERTGFSTLWSWDGKSWKKELSTNPGLFIETMQPWVGGRLLALEQSGMVRGFVARPVRRHPCCAAAVRQDQEERRLHLLPNRDARRSVCDLAER